MAPLKDTSDSESVASNNSDDENENSEDNESDEQQNQEEEEGEGNDNDTKLEIIDGGPYYENGNNNNNNRNKWTRNNRNARGNNNSSWRGKFNNKNKNGCNNNYSNNNNNNNNKKDSNWNDNKNNNNNKGNKNNNKGNKNNNNNNNNNGKNKNKKKDEFQELVSKVRQFVFGSYSYHPLNSWILQLHYRVAFIFFLIYWYITVKYNWFGKAEITCISGFNADSRPEPFLENICLSYSFIEINDAFGENRRKYILFYRWVPYIFGLLCMIFYTPRCLMKLTINPRFLGFVKEIQQASVKISAEGSDSIKENTILYFERNLATHKHIYYAFVFIHIFCVFVSCGTFLFLDFLMQGEFWGLALTFPFSRDPRTFRDRLSETFPPFVNCNIKPPMNMRNTVEDEFYCHLLYNELYEKLFVFLWIFMIFLIFVGMVYMSLIFLMSFTPFCKLLFCTHLELPKLKVSKERIFNTLDIGDIFCLYLIKQLVSELQFCKILEGLEVVLKKHANILGGNCINDKNMKVYEFEKSLLPQACLPKATLSANLQNGNYKICRQRSIGLEDIFV